MCAVEGDVSSGFDCSVEADDIVVTDRPESAGTVPAFDVGGGDVLFRTGGGSSRFRPSRRREWSAAR